MMLSDQDIAFIELKFSGELSSEDQQLFNKKMKSNADFKEEVLLQSRLLAGVDAIQKDELKGELKNLFGAEDNVRPFPTQNNKNKAWYWAAASLVLIIIVFVSKKFNADSFEDTYLAYYQPYDGVVITRSPDHPSSTEIDAYNSGQYEKALRAFLSSSGENITEGQRCLLIGNCYLNLHKADSSLIWFNKILPQEDDLIKDNGDWYRALTLLSKGEIDESRKILESIVYSKRAYAPKATELLKEDVFK